MTRLVIGTRRSRLARAQTELVRVRLGALHSDLEFVVEDFLTFGDQMLDRPIHEIGTKGLFTRELDQALLDGRIDLAVHSLKDLPAELPDGIEVVAVPERESPEDALVARESVTLRGLPARSRLGTSSLRRRIQLARARPDLTVVDLRGNLDTRWRKHLEGECDALVLASAGVRRMGWEDRLQEVLDPAVCVPAPCQGALAVTARSDDLVVRGRTAPLADSRATVETECERAFLVTLGGGCSVPAGALARLKGDRLQMRTFLAPPDGSATLTESAEGDAANAAALGEELAGRLLERGGREWVPAAHGDSRD